MKVLFLLMLVLLQPSFANEKKKAETTVEIKKGSAVSAFSKEDGFKLTNKAISNLGVTFKAIKGSGPWMIPKTALVRIKHSTGVYRKWDGWITMVLVKVIKRTKETVTIKSVDLQDRDELAITGVPFLRMTESDLNSDTVDACSH
ncbi:MAG: hypothetical protein HN509_02115 [Halobacteriovoraceae bacterium]|jgi:hypothetical protein|nr:hypothetical protein [Halobacteriovoraceae bacterium]MBT5093869.1 hypothetical protein [Halobacteriovoraceae bacterium]